MAYNGRVTSLGPFGIGSGAPLVFIGGPCVIESESHARDLGRAIKAVATACGLPYVFKASFDKANRTSLSSFRGPGLEEGLRILGRIKADLQVPILTDIHEPAHAARAADVVDILQIPAFLSRQTDLLVAAARTGRVVNVKKGQFLAPLDMRHAVQKVRASGNERVIVTERGATFGYHNLVVDMRAFPMIRSLGVPVVFDVTHSLQLPGAGDGVTTGQAEYIEPLARAGVAAGVDGLFMEIHDDPARAKSDGQNAMRLDLVEPLLRVLVAIDAAARAAAAGRRIAPPEHADMARPDNAASATAPALALARKVLETEAAAILGLVDTLDHRFERVVEMLQTCRGRVIVTGMGKSGIICRKIAATLSSTGTPAFFLHPAEAVHGDLGVIQPDDVIDRGVAQRRDPRGPACAGDDQAARGAPGGADRTARLVARGGRRCGARHPRQRGSVSAQPRAHGEHDRRARAGRRALR